VTPKATLVRGYRALLGALVLAAIAYQLVKGLEGPGWSTANYFSYFTILSNLFAVGVFLVGALRPVARRSAGFELLRGACVMYMLTTGIVYAVLLSGERASIAWVNDVVHRAMPIALALDWLIDPPRWALPVRRVLLWMAFPLLYVIYTLIRGSIVNWYPYFFVNPHHHGGYLRVAAACVAIGIGQIALALLIAWIGSRRAEPVPAALAPPA
jgi:hypothetical protein